MSTRLFIDNIISKIIINTKCTVNLISLNYTGFSKQLSTSKLFLQKHIHSAVSNMPPKRGRPPKIATVKKVASSDEEEAPTVKEVKKRGRPVKNVAKENSSSDENETLEEAATRKGQKQEESSEEEETPPPIKEVPKKRGRKPAVKIIVPKKARGKLIEKKEEPSDNDDNSENDTDEKDDDADEEEEEEEEEEAVEAVVEKKKVVKPAKKKPKTEVKFMNPTSTDLKSIEWNCTKVNGKGEKYNMKICSWNVSGIRAVINKNGYDYLIKEDADIIALQEVKCDQHKLPEEIKIPGYKHYFVDSAKSGYCGVGLYYKKEPISIKSGLKNSGCETEGRLITAEFENFYLVNVYVPNSGPKLVSMPKRLKWNAAFKAYIQGLNGKKPVIICGDMNVSHTEIDLANPKGNVKHAGFTPEERAGMTDLLSAGFVDTFRQLYPDQTGAYTFWSYFANARSKNIGWRLDYFIVSERIKDNICDNVIRSTVYGSDHCPIVLFANI